MKFIRLIFALLVIFFFTGCAALRMESRMHQIELGMSKQKTLSILGKEYEVVGAQMTPEGAIERISYYSITVEEECYYILSFKDNLLVEWYKEKLPKNTHNHPVH